jgi:hypothetical protein
VEERISQRKTLGTIVSLIAQSRKQVGRPAAFESFTIKFSVSLRLLYNPPTPFIFRLGKKPAAVVPPQFEIFQI